MLKRKLPLAGAICALALLGGVLLGGTATAAKKKHTTHSRANVTKIVNAVVPNRTAGGPYGVLRSPITLGKKYKGKTIGDVNVTFQTGGSTATAASDLLVKVSAPNGNTVVLVSTPGLLGQNVGPLTLDDETRAEICNDTTPPCADPDDTLGPPYAGTAEPFESLSHLNGGKMKGTWVLSVFDTDPSPASKVNVLGSWNLDVTADLNTRKPA
jgi:hypothetical protein